MAIKTINLYTDYDGEGNSKLSIRLDYDDALNPPLLTTIHVVNNDIIPRVVNATSTFNGKHYSFIVPVGAVIDQNIPANLQNRLELEITPSGKLNGVEWDIP